MTNPEAQPQGGGAPGATDAERAAWLADKIGALGDYAKEAAAMLRRWPASGEAHPIWPIARLFIDSGGNICGDSHLYAPGLPEGVHDVYPLPVNADAVPVAGVMVAPESRYAVRWSTGGYVVYEKDGGRTLTPEEVERALGVAIPQTPKDTK
jgi:hypothetical protein